MAEENEKPQKVLRIYSWELSSTKAWNPKTELLELRDKTPAELVSWLWEPGGYAQNTAIMELISHGLPRKAAEVARALVEAHPVVEKSIREGFGDLIGDSLLRTPLENIPQDPIDFAPNVRIEYIEEEDAH